MGHGTTYGWPLNSVPEAEENESNVYLPFGRTYVRSPKQHDVMQARTALHYQMNFFFKKKKLITLTDELYASRLWREKRERKNIGASAHSLGW